jgi:hypothetical protein
VGESAAQIAATAGVPRTFERRRESPADAILFLGEWNDLLTALPFLPQQVRTSGLTMGADQCTNHSCSCDCPS